jgi:hypothetical protein
VASAADYHDWAQDAYIRAQNDIRRGLNGHVPSIGSAIHAAFECADHCIDSILVSHGEQVPGSAKERKDVMRRLQPPFTDADIDCYVLLEDEVVQLRLGTTYPDAQTIDSQVIRQYLPCISRLVGIR